MRDLVRGDLRSDRDESINKDFELIDEVTIAHLVR